MNEQGVAVRDWSEPREIAEGLWRWTAPHPDWRPPRAAGSVGDWDRMVGSVLYATDEAVVLFDPLIQQGDAKFWGWLDDLVRARRVVVLTTLKWHRRSRDDVVARYRATTSRARAGLPAGVESITLRGAGETLFWLPAPRALVVGDRILGDEPGHLRLCPDSWMSYLSPPLRQARLRELLEPVLDLPVERVLISHGEPVLSGGADALRALLR